MRIRSCGSGSPPRAKTNGIGNRPFRVDLSGQQPNALLEIGAILKQCGLRPLIVYVGSFIRRRQGRGGIFARATELGIADDVIVSGFVASDHEVFGLFSEVDAFCYPLDEALPPGVPAY
jgi:hypothetical protein